MDDVQANLPQLTPTAVAVKPHFQETLGDVRVTVNVAKMVAPTTPGHAATGEKIALLADISVSVANENGIVLVWLPV